MGVCRGWCVVDIGARDSYTLEPARGSVAKGRPGAHGTGTAGRRRGREELERRARAMDGSVASKGSEREAARPQRRGDCFVFAQPIRRPQLSSATVQATNNVLDRGHQTVSIMHDGPSNKSVGVIWMDMYPDGGLPLPPTFKPMVPPAFTIHPRPSRQSPP